MCCEGCLVALMMGISVTDRGFLYLAAHTTETTPPPISAYVVAIESTGLACNMRQWK